MTHITMLTHPGKFQEIQRPLFWILLTQRWKLDFVPQQSYDVYNHADSSWKFQEIQRPLFLNFVDSAVKLDFVPQLRDWISLIRSGAWPYDAYNHADSSWKIPGNTATVISNFVDSAGRPRCLVVFYGVHYDSYTHAVHKCMTHKTSLICIGLALTRI